MIIEKEITRIELSTSHYLSLPYPIRKLMVLHKTYKAKFEIDDNTKELIRIFDIQGVADIAPKEVPPSNPPQEKAK